VDGVARTDRKALDHWRYTFRLARVYYDALCSEPDPCHARELLQLLPMPSENRFPLHIGDACDRRVHAMRRRRRAAMIHAKPPARAQDLLGVLWTCQRKGIAFKVIFLPTSNHLGGTLLADGIRQQRP
jgi:hypothetical protein